uniref:Type IV pili twitching motility protein n=1 Tax=Microcystis aeruginosa UWOCC MRA TaxID=392552 RepID=A3E238_MICAE|nr:type IV pili twitching motility protein [Microcystis aeruginosa UWOCC MRA]
MELMIEDLMEQLVEMGGSDMHIQSRAPVYFRISGKLIPINEKSLTPQDCQKLIFSMLNNTQIKELEQNWELDCSYGVKGLARFRINVYKERGAYAACLRALSSKMPNFEQLNLPEVIRELSERPRGLILVTGQTGSGKTTTLAAILDLINRTRSEIFLLEDPIEYVFPNIKSLFHHDKKEKIPKSFATAFRSSFYGKIPDIILVGEMREFKTIALAVFSQNLVKEKNPKPGVFGRAMVQEIMVVTPTIANLNREGKAPQVYLAIQTGMKLGMQNMEQGLANLVVSGVISFEEAISKSSKPDELQRLVAGSGANAKTKARL